MEGNQMKMREAVETALTTIRGVINGTISRTNNSVFGCRDKLKAALAAPSRQCDVGTAEEQEERFKHFCASNYSACDVDMECCRCPLESEKAGCEFTWAQMPYEAEEGGTI